MDGICRKERRERERQKRREGGEKRWRRRGQMCSSAVGLFSIVCREKSLLRLFFERGEMIAAF